MRVGPGHGGHRRCTILSTSLQAHGGRGTAGCIPNQQGRREARSQQGGGGAGIGGGMYEGSPRSLLQRAGGSEPTGTPALHPVLTPTPTHHPHPTLEPTGTMQGTGNNATQSLVNREEEATQQGVPCSSVLIRSRPGDKPLGRQDTRGAVSPRGPGSARSGPVVPRPHRTRYSESPQPPGWSGFARWDGLVEAVARGFWEAGLSSPYPMSVLG